MGREFWQRVMAVRGAVNKAMEEARAEGRLRGSLDAAVTLYCAPPLLETLRSLGDELRFVLITSTATLEALDTAGGDVAETELAGLKLRIDVLADEKCERCWHRSADVGAIAAHPVLCGRCVENVDGDGELRRYA
jgi:isoleucyl-tRNA synthetase